MRRRMKANAGFTLVELIVVIAILGILAGVAVPTYSGYVKKANLAADETLVDAINTAFTAACIENQVDVKTVTSGQVDVDIDGTTKKLVVNTLVNDDIKESFGVYFGNNSTAQFKEATALDFQNGMFVINENARTFTGLFNTIKDALGQDRIDQVKNSNLGQYSTEELFTQMNGALDTAGALNLHTLTGESFMLAFAGYLGVDPTADDINEKYAAAIESLDVDAATAMNNAIALYAAENSASVTLGRVSGWLGGDTTTDDLQKPENVNAETLADVAAIYGLYLSYCKDADTAPEGNAMEVITDALADEDFADWVADPASKAADDLTAYKTYMEIVNEAAKDETARNEILKNGFNNAEMQELMQELMGN